MQGPVSRQERNRLVDALRGFAVLGILLFNIQFYSRGSEGLAYPSGVINQLVILLIRFFVEAKFYSLFSLLFGWGLAVQMRGQSSKGGSFLLRYARRLLVLLFFGLAHGVLLWYGDILTFYAMLGFLLLLFRNQSSKALMASAVFALLISIFLAMPWELVDSIRTGYLDITGPLRLDRYPESLYLHGSYLEATRRRIQDYFNSQVFSFFSAGNIFAMFLVGLAFGKERVFSDLKRSDSGLQKAFWPLLITGVGLNGLHVALTYWPDIAPTSYLRALRVSVRTFGAPALTLTYILGISRLFQKGLWRQRIFKLAPVGQMALTNYISHSIICTLLFYGYGLGLYGRLGPAATLLLAIAIFGLQIQWSIWWLDHFSFGPLEWLWRSITYNAAQPWRRHRMDPADIGNGMTQQLGTRHAFVLGAIWMLLLLWSIGLIGWRRSIREQRVDVRAFTAALADQEEDPSEVEVADIRKGEAPSIERPDIETPIRVPGPLVLDGDLTALAETFNGQAAMQHVATLASDQFMGRLAGTPDGWAAGDYIADGFRQFGLQPAGENGSYFQRFPVNPMQLSDEPRLLVSVPGSTNQVAFELNKDFNVYTGKYGGEGSASGPVIWGNNCDHADFDKIAITDAIVLCRQDPEIDFDRHAIEHGAAGVLLMVDPNVRPLDFAFPFRPSLVPVPIPVFRVSPDVVRVLALGGGISPRDLLLTYEPRLLNTNVTMHIPLTSGQNCAVEECLARNVLGVLPGRDPDYANDVVILGAHYDHMGSAPDGTIWPGANDDASGVAVLLEIARSWQEAGYVPRRTVVFAAWDGEELGLLGSRHYVQNPIYPLQDTLAVLQLDMVAAGGPVLGVDGRGGFTHGVELAAQSSGVQTLQTEIGRSDHVAFWEVGVPGTALTWYDPDGEYVDYHRPIDKVSRIDTDAFETAGIISNMALLAKVEGEPLIKDLLLERETALLMQDMPTFLQKVHPDQRESEEGWFRSVQSVDLEEVDLELETLGLQGSHASGQVRMEFSYKDSNSTSGESLISTSYPIRFERWGESWVWAGPELRKSALEDMPELPTEVNIFVQEGIELDLQSPVLSAFESTLAYSNALGLEFPESLRIEYYVKREGIAMFVDLNSDSNDSIWLSPGVIKVFGTSSSNLASTLQAAFIRILLYEAGIEPDVVPWMWDGLPITMRVAGATSGEQQRYISDLHLALMENNVLDEHVANWAAVEDLRVAGGWARLAEVIDAIGHFCALEDCSDEAQIDAVHRYVFGMPKDAFDSSWRSHWSARFDRILKGIQSTLDVRAEAIMQSNPDQFLESVDGRVPSLIAEQRQYFERLKAAGIQEMRWEPNPLAILADGTVIARLVRTRLVTEDGVGGSTPDQREIARFTLTRNGYRWAGALNDSMQDDEVLILLPDDQLTLGEEILAFTQQAYARLSSDLTIALPSGIVIKLYEDEDVFRDSIPLMTDEATPPIWTDVDQSIKLLLPSDGGLSVDSRALLVRSIIRKMLLEAGIEEEWLLRGLSSTLVPELDSRARQQEATRYLWRISSAAKRDQLIRLTELPGDERLDDDQRKVANAQSWDAVTYLIERHGIGSLGRLISEVRVRSNFDDAFESVFGIPYKQFADLWFEAYLRAHVEDGWIETANGFNGEYAYELATALGGSEYAGRKVGSEGAELAADYLAKEFERQGLHPVILRAVDENPDQEGESQPPSSATGPDVEDFPSPMSFFQEITVQRVTILRKPELRIQNPSGMQILEFVYRENFLDIPLAYEYSGPVHGELIWVGGDAYPDIDMSGKIILRKASEDLLADIREAQEHAVDGLILISQNRSNRGFLKKWATPLGQPEIMEFPVLQISQQGFEDFVDETELSVLDFTSGAPIIRPGLEAEINLPISLPEEIQTANVLALLPGSDPDLADEIIILGAHYDHVGDDPMDDACRALTENGDASEGSTRCGANSSYRFPGINDDASGVAVLLELARLWSQSSYRPARSVLFAAWTAQESGEIGSRYYVAHPAFPLDQTLAMIQLDTVGGGSGYCLDASGVFEQDGLLVGRAAILQDLVDARVNISQEHIGGAFHPRESQWMQWPDVDQLEESDHLTFRNEGVPSLLLRWCGAEETNEPLGEDDEVLAERLAVTGRVVTLLAMTLAR